MRDELSVHVRFRNEAELCGWSWDIRNRSGAIVASSWESEWMVYDSSADALTAGMEHLDRRALAG